MPKEEPIRKHAQLFPEDLTALKAEMLLLPQKIEKILAAKDEIQLCARKYATTKDFIYIARGINYPTALDILYESCVENADETLFSHAKMENRYGASDKKIEEVINELLDKKYITQSGSKFKIVGTPWD